MDNDVKNPRRSISLGCGVYRSEELNKIILQTQKHTDLLVFYIDYIIIDTEKYGIEIDIYFLEDLKIYKL